ncbi:MAG: hypothetical protein IIC67_12570 [Thaumarchaeota archaeon]|nr:hypothetical protein [Nitrososphaerota archaeon]
MHKILPLMLKDGIIESEVYSDNSASNYASKALEAAKNFEDFFFKEKLSAFRAALFLICVFSRKYIIFLSSVNFSLLRRAVRVQEV